MQQTVPGLSHLGRHDHPATPAGCTASGSTAQAISSCLSTAREVLDRWRQNWNPWYHNFDLELAAGQAAQAAHRVDSGLRLHRAAAQRSAARSGPPLADASPPIGQRVDYYFVPGAHMDEVIAGYRELTGKAPIMPQWAYGFWQSRQRYETQDQLLGVLARISQAQPAARQYRPGLALLARGPVGLPMLRQGALSRPEGDGRRGARQRRALMISVWAKFYQGHRRTTRSSTRSAASTDACRTRGRTSRRTRIISSGCTSTGSGPGYFNAFYDPYKPAARGSTSAPGQGGIESKGFDAWWLDSRRARLPFEHLDRRDGAAMGPTAPGPAGIFNSYPLAHVGGVYEHQVADKPDDVRSSSRARLRRHPARQRRGLVGRRRVALGQSARPDLGRHQLLDVRRSQLEPRHRRLHDGTAVPEADAGGPRRMARAQHALVPVRRLLADFPKPRREYQARDFRMSPAGSPTYNSMVWYDRFATG